MIVACFIALGMVDTGAPVHDLFRYLDQFASYSQLATLAENPKASYPDSARMMHPATVQSLYVMVAQFPAVPESVILRASSYLFHHEHGLSPSAPVATQRLWGMRELNLRLALKVLYGPPESPWLKEGNRIILKAPSYENYNFREKLHAFILARRIVDKREKRHAFESVTGGVVLK